MQAEPKEVSADKATTPAEQALRPANGKARRFLVRLKDLNALGSLAEGEPGVCLVPVADHDYVLTQLLAEQRRNRTLAHEAKPSRADALVPCGECLEGLQMIDPYDGGTFITCRRCNGRGMLTTCPTCFGAVPANREHLLANERPTATFLAVLKDAKANALDVFTESHGDAKQAIEYMAALLEVSDLAKQGGAV